MFNIIGAPFHALLLRGETIVTEVVKERHFGNVAELVGQDAMTAA